MFSLVKSVSGISKKKGYDEDDTAAISLITGLYAASVCIFIELIKNACDKDLTDIVCKIFIINLEKTSYNQMR